MGSLYIPFFVHVCVCVRAYMCVMCLTVIDHNCVLCVLQCSDPYVTVTPEGVTTLVCESDLDGDGVSDSQVRKRV